MNAVRLERPGLRHREDFLQAVRRSRRLHRGWVSPPADKERFARFVRSLRRRDRASFLVRTAAGDLVGVINVSEIVRGNFKSAYLGYYAFQPLSGRGLMRQGLKMVIARCFGPLKLHRLEANIQPANVRSIALVRGLGFHCEGMSPRYLKIGGRWRDHQRWALLADDRRTADREGKTP